MLTRLLAPFVPFVTEEVHRRLVVDVRPDLPDSVHLRDWPEPDGALVDERLGAQMALVRRLVELGRAARAESGVKTRQPLGRALVGAAGWDQLPDELKAQVTDELNVVSLESLSSAGSLVDASVKGNFRALGKRFGKGTQSVATAVASADAETLVAELRSTGSATVVVEGESHLLVADELVVTETPREGWAVASAAGETLALDLEITPALRRTGRVRDVVRLVQEARKTSGLDVSDPDRAVVGGRRRRAGPSLARAQCRALDRGAGSSGHGGPTGG